MPLDLRKIYHATTLANERNFTKAADRLCITQPALSRSITKLEEELGVPLFNRNPGDVTLTPAGKAFIERSKPLLQQAHQLSCDMALVRDGLSGNLTIGMTPYPAAAFLPYITSEVLHKQEGVKMRVEIASRERLLSQLGSESIEFFLGSSNLLSLGEHHLADPLAKMRLSLFVRKGHPLAGRKISDADDLLAYPFVGAVLTPDHTMGFKMALGLPENANFQLTVACDDFAVLKPLALSSNAVLIAPHRALGRDGDNGNFREIEVTGALGLLANASIEICIIRFANRELSPAAQSAIRLLKEFARA